MAGVRATFHPASWPEAWKPEIDTVMMRGRLEPTLRLGEDLVIFPTWEQLWELGRMIEAEAAERLMLGVPAPETEPDEPLTVGQCSCASPVEATVSRPHAG